MEYDSRISIAYDTIFYGVLYFNTRGIQATFAKNYGISDTDLKYFYSLEGVHSAAASGTISILL